MLDVAIVTYNQENCIAQAIESVLMQKTNFPFRIIIGEDCSTDNTLQICKSYAHKYPTKIVLLENTQNIGLVKNYKTVFAACTSKYMAILEGDDYWTDEYKLQKQVDVLENDESVGFVHSNYNISTSNIIRPFLTPPKVKLQGNIFSDLIEGNFIGPLTVVLRKALLDKFISFDFMLEQNFKTIDYFLWLELSYRSNVAFINQPLAVYRKEIGSISNPKELHNIETFAETQRKTLHYFYNKYNFNKKHLDIALNNLWYSLFLKAIKLNNFEKVKTLKAKFKPMGIIQIVRYHFAINILFIKFGKLFKVYN